MKIAFLSYEYPPDTGYGGVATYTNQVAKMMAQKGHQVEVFAGSEERSGTFAEEGIVVHRFQANDPENFYEPIARLFAQRHQAIRFDVLEAPELDAEARYIVQMAPDIPLVVKLHSGNLLLWEYNNSCVSGRPSLKNKFKWYLKGKKYGYPPFWQIPTPPSPPKLLELDGLERSITLQADQITAPSQAIIDRMIQRWKLDPHRVVRVSNPYIPSPQILAIPADSKTNVITFIGRFELRKGIIDLAMAIPLILRQYPQARFRLVGGTDQSFLGDTRDYLEKFLLHRYRNAVEFTGAVPLDHIPGILAATDICVFPSLWDNFPCVCLEAMAAARGVIGTDTGGMAEMIDHEKVGILIPAFSPHKIAESVLELLHNVPKRIKMGMAARKKVLSEYSLQTIGDLQESVYQRAIARKK